MGWYDFRPYVPVATRRAQAKKKMETLRKKGQKIQPVELEGRTIARTFWGKAWCDHMESFHDYENRLPRGRTYIRNGSVCHLDIAKGEVKAMVSGSELYNVKVTIKTLPGEKWKEVKNRCAGQIGSLLELLQGRLSANVMSVVTHRNQGLFPLPGEISLKCSCPDWAVMCKHVAAVLYGVGARLDERPELLFLLRGVDHDELISTEVGLVTAATEVKSGRRRIADEALADVFGIEMPEEVNPAWTRTLSGPKKDKPFQPKTSRPLSGSTTGLKAKAGKRTKPTRGKSADGNRRRSAGDTQPLTGKAVAGLRAKFGMSQTEFAGLMGVSLTTIANWEKKPGVLGLRSHSLETWNEVKGLTKLQARRKLNRR
jgi:uncharacterized Zn finger protein/DNA-binding XRE family transcriptional regulator